MVASKARICESKGHSKRSSGRGNRIQQRQGFPENRDHEKPEEGFLPARGPCKRVTPLGITAFDELARRRRATKAGVMGRRARGGAALSRGWGVVL